MIVGAKPCDDGDGMIVRRSCSMSRVRRISIGIWPAAYAFKQARRTNLVELNGDAITVGADGRASIDVPAWGIGTARLSTPTEAS
jgi:hypothetical protein